MAAVRSESDFRALALTEEEWKELLRSERRLGREIEKDGVAA